MRRTSLERAIWKPRLMMGCEPFPFMVILACSLLLVLEGSLWVKVAGVALFIVFVGLLAIYNAKEPLAVQIFFRYRVYQDFYANNALHPGQSSRFKNF